MTCVAGLVLRAVVISMREDPGYIYVTNTRLNLGFDFQIETVDVIHLFRNSFLMCFITSTSTTQVYCRLVTPRGSFVMHRDIS